MPLPFFLRAPPCHGLGVAPCTVDADCANGARCLAASALNLTALGSGVCANLNVGGGCGGLGWNRMVVGATLAAYIIVYGQCQSYTPQLVTGPLGQTPPNKLTCLLYTSPSPRDS